MTVHFNLICVLSTYCVPDTVCAWKMESSVTSPCPQVLGRGRTTKGGLPSEPWLGTRVTLPSDSTSAHWRQSHFPPLYFCCTEVVPAELVKCIIESQGGKTCRKRYRNTWWLELEFCPAEVKTLLWKISDQTFILQKKLLPSFPPALGAASSEGDLRPSSLSPWLPQHW